MNRPNLIALALLVLLAAPAAASDKPLASVDPSIAVSKLTTDRFELVYSGTKFTSRDDIEQKLLLSSARLALGRDAQWFSLLALPGETAGVHPSRSAAVGAKYGHWQPHWSFYLAGTGLQWWHPEWGDEFWTKEVNAGSVQRFQVHAMISLGKTAGSEGEELQFNAAEVVRDLSGPPVMGAKRSRR